MLRQEVANFLRLPPFRQKKSTDLRVNIIREGICFLGLLTFSRAKSAETGGSSFGGIIFQNLLPRETASKKEVDAKKGVLKAKKCVLSGIKH